MIVEIVLCILVGLQKYSVSCIVTSSFNKLLIYIIKYASLMELNCNFFI